MQYFRTQRSDLPVCLIKNIGSMVGAKPDSSPFIFGNGLDGVVIQQSRRIDVGTDDANLVSVVAAKTVHRAIPHQPFAVLKNAVYGTDRKLGQGRHGSNPDIRSGLYGNFYQAENE